MTDQIEDIYFYNEDYKQASAILSKFAKFITKQLCQELAGRMDLAYALSILQFKSGLNHNTNYALAKLCADCFMFGLFVMSSYTNHDGNFNDLYNILKNQMKLSASESKDAATHATSVAPNADLVEQIKYALQFHGGKSAYCQ